MTKEEALNTENIQGQGEEVKVCCLKKIPMLNNLSIYVNSLLQQDLFPTLADIFLPRSFQVIPFLKGQIRFHLSLKALSLFFPLDSHST